MGVVPGAFLGVREDFVCALDFGELFCCDFDVAVVAVGVELEGFAAVCFFDSFEEDGLVFEDVCRVEVGLRLEGTYSSSVAVRDTPSNS